MFDFPCCWPRYCAHNTNPLRKTYIEWAGAGFWFEGMLLRRDDGLLVFIDKDGSAYPIQRFMDEDTPTVSPKAFYPPYPQQEVSNG